MESSRPALALFWSKACERSVELDSGSRWVAYVLYAKIALRWRVQNAFDDDLEPDTAVERIEMLCILKDIMLDAAKTHPSG